MSEHKPTVVVDLLGVLCVTETDLELDDPAILRPGARAFLVALNAKGYQVQVHSLLPAPVAKEFLKQHNLVGLVATVTEGKAPLTRYLDPLAVRFEGDFNAVYSALDAEPFWAGKPSAAKGPFKKTETVQSLRIKLLEAEQRMATTLRVQLHRWAEEMGWPDDMLEALVELLSAKLVPGRDWSVFEIAREEAAGYKALIADLGRRLSELMQMYRERDAQCTALRQAVPADREAQAKTEAELEVANATIEALRHEISILKRGPLAVADENCSGEELDDVVADAMEEEQQ